MSDYVVSKAIDKLARAIEVASFKRTIGENISFGKDDGVFFITDDLDQIRWRTGSDNGMELNGMKDRGDWAQIKRWCEENCKDLVCYLPANYGNGTFYFFSKDDMMLFKLVWT